MHSGRRLVKLQPDGDKTMKSTFKNTAFIFAALIGATNIATAADTSPVKFAGIMELSGSGATPGTNFNNGGKLEGRKTNAAGGILGRPIDYEPVDTQTNPGVAKALAQKAIDDGAYV